MFKCANQEITDRYAIYNADCMEVMPQFPDASMHFSVYSPPFAGLYHYTSSERDLSNVRSYSEFFEHYRFVVAEIHRLTMPGRMTAVHCMDIPSGNTGKDTLRDFPGDIIRLHAELGFGYVARYHVWKEPLGVRNRTLAKGLTHKTVIDDATRCTVASADYLLIFRKGGDNPVPVQHPNGLVEYYGEREIPAEVLPYKEWSGPQIENRYSQWIWRQYASAFWDDVRIGHVLPFRDTRSDEDEKHVHPLQLDVIGRAIALWTNPGERVFTPFMGVGSEVYGAVHAGRVGVGVELKSAYYDQTVRNMAAVDAEMASLEEPTLFEEITA